MANDEFVKNLTLPGRFEQLEAESKKTGCDIAGIVQPVSTACEEIEIVLREVDTSGLGRLQIFHGTSGSGKTTFLHGLQYFFRNIVVVSFPNDLKITELANFIKNDSLHREEHRLYIIHDRDNPNENDDDLRRSFESLRSLFRTAEGKVLVVWPITDLEAAKHISGIAWHIGRDSLLGTRASEYNFEGLPKESYVDVADITTRSLNAGENLESFGIGHDVAQELARKSETIGEYYSRLNAKSAERNASTMRLLKARVRPHIWVVLPGDDLKELDRTISSLTQGTRNRIDIDKIAEFLDNKENESAYLTEWRARRADMAYIMRILDVRLFELPPNASLATTRCYGEDGCKVNLKKKTETADNCAEILGKVRLGQALIDPESPLSMRIRDTSEEMAREYMAVQQLAAKGDKSLNKALSQAIKDFLFRNGQDIEITSEKQNIPGSQLCPDVQVPFYDGSIICLELTWRSTGKYLSVGEGERKPQNTLTQGHIMKYLLDKVMEYVKDLQI